MLANSGKPKDQVMEEWTYTLRILSHTLDFQEFGILPRGIGIHASDSNTNWVKVLFDVLDTLKWLYSHHITHRDVRLDNIVWNVDHAVLIDLGSTNVVNFNGGYLCCSPRLLGSLECVYTPTAADACLDVLSGGVSEWKRVSRDFVDSLRLPSECRFCALNVLTPHPTGSGASQES